MEAKSLYIHFPFCISKCSYCDFFSKPCASIPDSYVDAVCIEISQRLGNQCNIETVYFGGGTPSLLSPLQIKKLSDIVYSHSTGTIKEFTFEVNPDDVTESLLKTLSDCKITRISCGIQSLSDNVLTFANRRASVNQIINALNLFEKFWNGRLSLDLISGLPYETEESFFKALNTIVSSKADHISMYSLTLEDETVFGKLLENNELPYDDCKAEEMWMKGRDFLEAKGFHQYEVSNFCRGNNISLHNMVYWRHESYWGIGAGGTGTIYRNDGSAFRWTNISDIEIYTSFWNENNDLSNVSKKIPQEEEYISFEDSVFEFFMMGLRTLEGFTENDFYSAFNRSVPESFCKLYESWKVKKLCTNDEKKYALNREGILFLNRFLEELMEVL